MRSAPALASHRQGQRALSPTAHSPPDNRLICSWMGESHKFIFMYISMLQKQRSHLTSADYRQVPQFKSHKVEVYVEYATAVPGSSCGSGQCFLCIILQSHLVLALCVNCPKIFIIYLTTYVLTTTQAYTLSLKAFPGIS